MPINPLQLGPIPPREPSRSNACSHYQRSSNLTYLRIFSKVIQENLCNYYENPSRCPAELALPLSSAPKLVHRFSQMRSICEVVTQTVRISCAGVGIPVRGGISKLPVKIRFEWNRACPSIIRHEKCRDRKSTRLNSSHRH